LCISSAACASALECIVAHHRLPIREDAVRSQRANIALPDLLAALRSTV
jgi:hypothetical protein